MKKIAFLFPGQGSQYVGMGKGIMDNFSAASELMKRAEELLKLNLSKICFYGSTEELNNTKNTQPAIYTVSLMINRVLTAEGIKPVTVAGHSLGEYTALAAANVFSFEDGLRLVRERGILMDEALPAGKGTMAAIIGLSPEEIEDICKQVNGICEIANYNSPQQIVISGEVFAIKEAMLLADKKGAKKVIELEVSGPFHSSLMRPAQNRLTTLIEEIEFHVPAVPVVANTTAAYVKSRQEIKNALIRQLTSSVHWFESINLMISEGIDIFVEVGPGKVLKGLLRRINHSVKAYNVEDLKSLHRLLQNQE
jgi:[acyl-carrier-protein] S-malonyltransferase